MRGGFQVTEASPGAPPLRPGQPAPDLLLCTVAHRDPRLAELVRDLVNAPKYAGAPVFVLVVDGGAEAVAEALLAGAQDAVTSPVHFGELRARIDAHLRVRSDLKEARDALRSRDLLFDIFQEVSAALRADEILQTLVRRVGQAFGLTHCSFVLTAPGEDQGRVVAVYENPAIRDLRVDLERYPEIQEAIRTERPVIVHDVREHPLFETTRRRWVQQQIEVNVQSAVALPVFVQGRAAGVFFLRTVQGDPELRPQDVAFANTIAQAAARVLENEERRAAIYRRQISAGVTDVLTGCASLDALDRRVRARRRAIACSPRSAPSCSARSALRISRPATAVTSSRSSSPRPTRTAAATSSSGCASCSTATHSPTSARAVSRPCPRVSCPSRTASCSVPRTSSPWSKPRSPGARMRRTGSGWRGTSEVVRC